MAVISSEGRPNKISGLVEPDEFAKKYAVDWSARLTAFDTTGGVAYALKPQSKSEPVKFYALVHTPSVPFRQDILESLVQSPVGHLLNPRATGIIEAAADRGRAQRLVTIVDCPQGPPLLKGGNEDRAFPPRYLRSVMLPHLIMILEALHGQGIVHRAIRPNNLFFQDASGQEVVLGECFSSPHAADQPSAFEPLDQTLAARCGRGAVDESADLFALGATLMSLYLGRIVGSGVDPERLYRQRLSQGSFWALAGGREIDGSMGVALRNLLNDDVDERWTLSDLALWADGSQPPRRSTLNSYGLSRPVQFRGRTFNDRRLLADAFAKDVPAAAAFLRDMDFAGWIQRTLSSEIFSDKQERLLNVKAEKDYSHDQTNDHAMVARVCAHLYPQGPIRFRGVTVCYDGIGPILSDALARNDREVVDALAGLIGTDLLATLLEISAKQNPVAARFLPHAARLRSFAADKTPGRGFDRALYLLNPSLPCQSKLLADQCVITLDQMAEALEAKATGQSRYMELVADAHILGFASAQVRGIDRLLPALAAAEGQGDRQFLISAEILAEIQDASDRGRLPNLAAQTLAGIKPMVGKLKSKQIREATMKLLENLKNSGSVREILQRIDYQALKLKDGQAFLEAKGQARRLHREITRLSRRVNPSDPDARQLAFKMSGFAGVIALGLASVSFWAWGW